MAASFRRYLWGGLAFTVLAATTVCVAAYSMARAIARITPATMAGERSDVRLVSLVAGLRQLEAYQRDYLLTGDSGALQGYQDRRDQFASSLASLGNDPGPGPVLRARTPQLLDLGRRRVLALDSVLALHRAGREAAARAFILGGPGRVLMDSLEALAEGLRMELAREITMEATSASQRTRSLALGIGLVALVGTLGIAIAFASLARVYTDARLRGQAQLAAERDRIQGILQTIPDPIFVKDLAGRYLMVNEAARRVYDKPVARILGTDDTAHFPPAMAAALMETDRGIMSSGREKVVEEEILGPEGLRTYLATKTPLRDADGGITGLVGLARDITDLARARSEREALLSRERAALLEARAARDALESVLNRITEGFVALDRNWCYTYVNPKAAALFGREPAALHGKHIWTEFPEGVGQPFHLAYERAMATQEALTFEEYYAPWNAWYVNRVYPSPDGLSIFFENITERKLRDLESHARQAHLTAVLAATPLAVITFDLEGRLTGWHGGAERIFGWRSDEVVGNPSPLLPPELPEEQALLPERILSGVRWSGRESIRVRKDGTRIPVSIWTATLYDQQGQISGAVGTYEDISARWALEQERARLLTDLRALARHLESVREEERLRIARDIHDQLGQALTGLRLEVDWLTQHAGRSAGELEHLDRVATVTTEILTSVRRISQELRPPLLDDLGLTEALDYTVREFSTRTGVQGELLVSDGFQEPESATATALYRVAQEALTNVARHAQASTVTLRLRGGVEGMRLAITDDGIGFDPAAPREGRSFGLIGMRERLAALGGELEVTSSPGAGTVVVATIAQSGEASAA